MAYDTCHFGHNWFDKYYTLNSLQGGTPEGTCEEN